MNRILQATACGLLCLAASTQQPLAQDAAMIAKGLTLAEANCAICHAIRAEGNSPLAIAPPFRDIAVTFDFADLEDAFNEGVATEHPAMPDWQMTPEQAEGLAAYIMSLAHAGKQKTDLQVPSQPVAGNP